MIDFERLCKLRDYATEHTLSGREIAKNYVITTQRPGVARSANFCTNCGIGLSVAEQGGDTCFRCRRVKQRGGIQ